MSRARAYCFTSFKLELFNDGFLIPAKVTYICWGLEEAPSTGASHIQGYVELSSAYSLRVVKQVLRDPAIHLERRLGTADQAVAYCKKDGIFAEHGARRNQGRRADLEGIRLCIADGGGVRAVLDLGASYQGVR